MSTQRDLEVHCRTKASSVVPLEVVAELIESEVGPIQREPGGIFFDGTVGTTHIRVTAVDVDTFDREKVANIISIVTELPELPIPGTDEALAVFNQYFSCSGFSCGKASTYPKSTSNGRLATSTS